MRSQSLIFGKGQLACSKSSLGVGGHVHSITLGLVVEISSKEGEEVVHFCLEELSKSVRSRSYMQYWSSG